MSSLPKDPKEGDKMECPDCGKNIIARLKTYKDNKYPSYVQWQNETETTAHRSKEGECQIQKETQLEPTNSSEYLKNKQKEIENKPQIKYSLTDELKKFVREETISLYLIDNEITNILKEISDSPINGSQVGKFSNRIVSLLDEKKQEISFKETTIKSTKNDGNYCSCETFIPNSLSNGKTCQTCLKIPKNEN